jgi:Cu-processing system permease protein
VNAVLALAGKELEDHLRNGWILAVSLAFAGFALVIALAGFGFAGQVGPGETAQTLVSMVSLVIYLIPLLGLLLGYDAIAGEAGRGTLALLRSYPVSAFQLLAGKLLGLGAVLAASLLLGLAAPAALDLWGGGSPLPWVVFFACSAWLGLIFLALALLLSSFAREGAAVLGIALAVWLLLAILFDLGLIGLLVATGGDLPPALVTALLHLNPTSLYRLFSLSALLGPEGLTRLGLGAHPAPVWSLAGGLLAWCALPALLAGWRLRKAP